MARARWTTLFACVLLLTTAAGCVHHHHHHKHFPRHPHVVHKHKHGPPPHAPAHGYRHKHHHHGVELVFDSRMGVYAVVGWHHHFFHDGHFFRFSGGGWQTSDRLEGGWAGVAPHRLPRGLAKKYGKHGHGKHPAKHGH